MPPPTVTVYVSGVHSGPNPSAGLGVARCIREAYPAARIVAVDYSPGSSGIHSELFNDVWVERPWDEIDLASHLAEIRKSLVPGAFWISTLDLEVGWLAGTDLVGARALIPPTRALTATAKPSVAAARRLSVATPDSISTLRPDWELHAFCRQHGWRVWVKGPHYEARRITDWPSFCRARQALSQTWSTDNLVLQAHVDGTEESIAYCAWHGRLLGAAHLEKRARTEQGKTWAGRIGEVPSDLLAELETFLASLEWTGGGEVEFVRAPDRKLHLIDWNPRFPAWIYGAALVGENLPGLLLQAAGAGEALPSRPVSREFTRVVMEVPVRASHPLPAASLPGPANPSFGKHPSGMPALARKMAASVPARRRPSPELDDYLQEALARVRADRVVTPSRLLLIEILRSGMERLRRLSAASKRDGAALRFAYSVKTNPDPRLMREVRRVGLHAEVISSEEAHYAIRSGFAAEQLVVNGPLATRVALPRGSRLAAWFADSLDALRQRLRTGSPAASYVGVRLRLPGVASRFGVDVSEPELFQTLADLLHELPSAQKLALHFHVPSDSAGVRRWLDLWEAFLGWAGAIEDCTGRPVRCIDAGGGWFPDDFEHDLLPRLPSMIAGARARLASLETLIVEPGKALAQPAAVLVTTVLEVRGSIGEGAEAVVDAAISDLPLALSSPHRILVNNGGRWRALAAGEDRILGAACMEHDVLADNIALPRRLRPGQRLVFCDAGAYDASMAYRFARGEPDER